MLGVDFVIKALFETSGVRPGVDCAWELRDETRIKRAALSKNLIGFTAPILLGGGESESVKRVDSTRLFQFGEQLLFQMTPS
jgi:hypothetical protein